MNGGIIKPFFGEINLKLKIYLQVKYEKLLVFLYLFSLFSCTEKLLKAQNLIEKQNVRIIADFAIYEINIIQ